MNKLGEKWDGAAKDLIKIWRIVKQRLWGRLERVMHHLFVRPSCIRWIFSPACLCVCQWQGAVYRNIAINAILFQTLEVKLKVWASATSWLPDLNPLRWCRCIETNYLKSVIASKSYGLNCKSTKWWYCKETCIHIYIAMCFERLCLAWWMHII